jgi:hypothetical protein
MGPHGASKRLRHASVLCFGETKAPRLCGAEEETQWLRVPMSSPERRYGTA